MEKDKRPMGASWWEGLTQWETGSCSDGRVAGWGGGMLSKSLIWFSIGVLDCVPSLFFTWGQTMVKVMKTMGASFKVPMYALLHSVPPTLQQATDNPLLFQRLLDTHGQVWVSLLWGHCSFLLGPGVHRFLFVPSKSLFSQSCVSSGSSMVG